MRTKLPIILFLLLLCHFAQAQDCSIIEKSIDLLSNNKKIESYLMSNIKILNRKAFLNRQGKLLIDISPHFILTAEERTRWREIDDTSHKNLIFKEIWNDSYCIFISKESGVPWRYRDKKSYFTPLTFYFFRPIDLSVSMLLYFEYGTDFKYKLYSMPRFGGIYILNMKFDANLNLTNYFLQEIVIL